MHRFHGNVILHSRWDEKHLANSAVSPVCISRFIVTMQGFCILKFPFVFVLFQYKAGKKSVINTDGEHLREKNGIFYSKENVCIIAMLSSSSNSSSTAVIIIIITGSVRPNWFGCVCYQRHYSAGY